MSNNDILKKLRVALHLRNDEIIEILKLVDFRITTSELGALFRNDDHPNFKPCGDQILINFGIEHDSLICINQLALRVYFILSF